MPVPSDPADEQTPEQREVRRLLGAVRHDEPMPPEVAARLDRVLADLAGGDHSLADAVPVTRLADRRRKAAGLLVAAAAVVVVGVGIGQVVDDPAAEDSLSGSRSEVGADGGPEVADGSADSGVPADSGAAGGAESAPSADTPPVPQLGSDDLADQISALDGLEVGLRSQFGDSSELVALQRDRATALSCGADAWGRGRFVAVRYEGTPAVLVFRRPLGDTRVVDLFRCGDTEPVRSVSLPAP